MAGPSTQSDDVLLQLCHFWFGIHLCCSPRDAVLMKQATKLWQAAWEFTFLGIGLIICSYCHRSIKPSTHPHCLWHQSIVFASSTSMEYSTHPNCSRRHQCYFQYNEYSYCAFTWNWKFITAQKPVSPDPSVTTVCKSLFHQILRWNRFAQYCTLANEYFARMFSVKQVWEASTEQTKGLFVRQQKQAVAWILQCSLLASSTFTFHSASLSIVCHVHILPHHQRNKYLCDTIL